MIRHSKASREQREFWQAPEKFLLFRGGVGSGKTRAGVIRALAMPRGSVGMVLSPTYPMLRDAVLPLFLGLARRAGILRRWLKGDRIAELAGGRTALFRTASDPDALRGPNLGWFWPDEAALMSADVWPVMLARLRLSPARAWVTTTPRGKLNWTHKTFSTGDPDYRTIVASTRGAFWNPAGFLASMLANYSADFAAQEVDAAVLDNAQEALLAEWWVDRLETVVRAQGRPAGRRRAGIDLGYGTGRDSFTMLVRDDLGILAGMESPYVDVGHAAKIMAEQSRRFRIRPEDLVYDAGGPGRDMPRYLEQHDLQGAIPYFGAGAGGSRAVNRRSKCAWRLHERLDPHRPQELDPTDQRGAHQLHYVLPTEPSRGLAVQPPFALPVDRPWWPRLAEELKELRYETVARKVALEPKEELVKRLKRSPNLADALIMSYYGGEAA